MDDIKIGDVVILKSDEHSSRPMRMTVENVIKVGDSKYLNCVFVDGDGNFVAIKVINSLAVCKF